MWSRTVAFGVVKRVAIRSLVTRPKVSQCRILPLPQQSLRPFALCMTTTSSSCTQPTTIRGISFVQQAVVDVLNDLFDPADVARGAALAKLNKGKKKKKRNDDNAEAEPELSEEEKKAIGDKAAAEAKPFTISDAMVTPATKAEFGDYQCNAAMGLAKSVGMNPRECAQKIVDGLLPKLGDIMEEPEIAGPGFINLRFKQDYLASAVGQMASDADGRLGIPRTSNKQKIVVDFLISQHCKGNACGTLAIDHYRRYTL